MDVNIVEKDGLGSQWLGESVRTMKGHAIGGSKGNRGEREIGTKQSANIIGRVS